MKNKFEPGQRVSFLYFGDTLRGTILQVQKSRETVLIEADHFSGANNIFVPLSAIKKLKPRKPRREFWVVAPNDAVNTVVVGTSLEIVQKVIGTDDEREIIHVREVK